MIRYSHVLPTSQPAASHSDGGRIFAVQSTRKRDCGSFRQIRHGAPDLARRDSSNLSEHPLVLSSMQRSIDLPNHLPIGLSILGQQLEQRVGWQRSGRYGCITVPRQD